ncbi:NYN domain-containing protein, partial [Candidatus Similichlamydia epinepheli]|uniref:NYN domain-containing protein n=1 Tax=Candidatus Similichlamydia epinepheli TaxID=1903953 RepID=UPI00130059F0
MRYLIDGHNWFFAKKNFSCGLFPREHQRFLKKLKWLLSHVNGDCFIVFDGGKHSNHLFQSQIDNIRIIYTGNKQSADEHILEILSFRRKKDHSTLVSSDFGLVRNNTLTGICVPRP